MNVNPREHRNTSLRMIIAGSMLVQKISNIRLRQPARSAIAALVALLRRRTCCLCLVACHCACDNPETSCQRCRCGTVYDISRKTDRKVLRKGAYSFDVARNKRILLSGQPETDGRKRKRNLHYLQKTLPVWDVPRVKPTEKAAPLLPPYFLCNLRDERRPLESRQAGLKGVLHVPETIIPFGRVAKGADCSGLLGKLSACLAH